jgi:hypothetical protein
MHSPGEDGTNDRFLDSQVGSLARLRGLEGFSGLRSLSINELAEKVFTTRASCGARRLRLWLVSGAPREVKFP